MAAHVWRKLADTTDAPIDEWTYSFGPNLVWLPSQLAKLSDREGGYAQTLLQAVSFALYKHLPLRPQLARFVAPIWDRLPLRDEIGEIDVPLDRVNFFEFDERWLVRRRATLHVVRDALAACASGAPLEGKVVASRYTGGLPLLRPGAVLPLLDMLTRYSDAVEEAAREEGGR